MSKAITHNESYRNVTNKKLSNTSQIKMFNILRDLQDDELFINIFRSYVLNESVFDNERYYELHEVTSTDWFDSIAHEYYQNHNLWWLVAMTNNIVNPFEGLNEGDFIRVLKPEHIYKILKEIQYIGQL